MSEAKLNTKFDIPVGELEERVSSSLNGDFSGYDRVVSPRDLNKIDEITLMRKELVESLIKNVRLRSEEEIYPYGNSKDIRIYCREPRGMDIGQRFVHDKKVLSIMKGLGQQVFSSFITNGMAKMPPVKIYGRDVEGEKCLALYVPPIVEAHGDHMVLIDGIHRSYISMSAGSSVFAVHITGVDVPLPFDIICWKDASLVEEKPPIDERYVNLDKSLFRDLGFVGIDG